MARILIVQGHPDNSAPHYCHALADAYRAGAEASGHQVEVVDLAHEGVGFLRSKAEWESEDVPEFVRCGQARMAEADHIVFVYPLWMGSQPALLKAWLEQVLRPRFAFNLTDDGLGWDALLGGQSARVIVTMGMPATVYRLFYGAHSLRSFTRNILKFSGIKPVRSTLIGMVEARDPSARVRWLERVEALGRRAS